MVLNLVPCSAEEPVMCVGTCHVAGMFHDHFSVCSIVSTAVENI